jgi:type II secretory pathway pseudopilin PulG
MLLRTKGRAPAPVPPLLRGHACAGFTLAEVLAALLFMAIVVPVAIEGLHIASLAGAVAAAKGQAARVGEDMLNQNLVTTNWMQTLQGTVSEGQRTFRWSLTSDPWTEDPSQAVMRQLSVTVNYTVRGRDYSIRLSTLVDSSLATGVPTGSTK